MKVLSPPSIMLIDDTEIDLFLNRKLIIASGITNDIESYNSAKDALEYLKNNQSNEEKIPDIILLDIQMPEINGFEFLECYNNLPENTCNKISVIMLSSTVDPVDKKRAIAHKHILDIMEKPLDTDLLKQILQCKQLIQAA